MRRFFFALAVPLLTASFFFASGSPPAHAGGCAGTIFGTYFPAQNVWSTKWTRNPNNCQQRSRAVWVQRGTNNHKTTFGGWVRSTSITSATSGGDSSWAPATCQAQVRHSSTDTSIQTINFPC